MVEMFRGYTRARSNRSGVHDLTFLFGNGWQLDDSKQFWKLPEVLKVDTCRQFLRPAVNRKNRCLRLAEVGIGPAKRRHILHGRETHDKQVVCDNQSAAPAAPPHSLSNVDPFDLLRCQMSILDCVANDQSARTSDPEAVTVEFAIMRMTWRLGNCQRPIGIDPQPELRLYTVTGRRVTRQPIGTLENMIKSRSFAAGDVDGSGRVALVVGTRALGGTSHETTCLYVYRFDDRTQAWERETIDSSGPLGFHCVAIGDVDGDGRSEIIASDDGRGQIKLYKRRGSGWEHEIIYAASGAIFCSSIHLIECDARE